MRKNMFLLAVIFLISAVFAFARVGGGDITFKTGAGNVVFSHESHVKGSGLQCTSCHDGLYLNTKKHVTVTMKEMEQGKSCGACHNGNVAFSVKSKDDCSNCHQK